jgi:uncharacterized linocin/CFP29 family protein
MNSFMSIRQFLMNSRVGGGVQAMRPFINRNGEARIQINAEQTLVANDATLRYDEWKDLDRTVLSVTTDRLAGVADLIGRGLVHNLGSLGSIISQWQKSSDMTPANFSMSGTTPGEKDRLTFDTDSVPVPIVHKDFSVNIRHLEASRRNGESIDTMQTAVAARKVAEASEDMLFSGEAITVEGGTIYGYLNYPNRNTMDNGTPWTSITDNQDIIDQVSAGLQMLRNDHFYGPYTIYIPGAYEAKLDEDFRANDNRTVKQRILALSGVAGITVVDRLEADTVVIVQLTNDVVDMAIAQQPTTLQWQSQGPLVEEFKVMACWVPRLKSDFENNCGILHIRPGT